MIRKKCKVCGKAFVARDDHCVYCSGKCAAEGNRQKAKAHYWIRAEGIVPEWKRERRCIICGTAFMPSSPTQIICKNPECRAEAQRQRNRGYRGPLEWKKPRQCIICGKEFMPINERMNTCGNPDCKRARKLAKQKAYNHAHRAEIREKERIRRGAERASLTPTPESLRDAVRMPDQAKPEKGRRKKPKPGSLEWCVREADRRGMSYGQFVAAMEQGVLDP